MSLLFLSLSLFSAPLYPFNVAPLMKSGGSVIFSIVPRVSLLPNSSRSSQNSVGPTDRNSLPCRYQSPLLLTIILICLSLLLSLTKPQRFLPTLRKQGFTVIVADNRTCRFLCAGFSVTKLWNVTSSGSVQEIIIYSTAVEEVLTIIEIRTRTNTTMQIISKKKICWINMKKCFTENYLFIFNILESYLLN